MKFWIKVEIKYFKICDKFNSIVFHSINLKLNHMFVFLVIVGIQNILLCMIEFTQS